MNTFNLTALQRELADYMSTLSERAYCAGWMDGLEFALWRAVVHGPFKYGGLQLTSEHVDRLLQLSHACGGWIFFHETKEETFIPLADWTLLTSDK